MRFVSRYVSHQPDAAGYIVYSEQEHKVWSHLYQRQMHLPNRACNAFMQGLKKLNLSEQEIPQLPEVSKN